MDCDAPLWGDWGGASGSAWIDGGAECVIPDVTAISWVSAVGRVQPGSRKAVGCSVDRSYELKPALLVRWEAEMVEEGESTRGYGTGEQRCCSSASVFKGYTPTPSFQHIGALRPKGPAWE